MRTIVCVAFTFLLILRGLATNYDDLVRQGYRWVTVDGPFACVSVEDLRKITGGGGDELELKMVEELKAFYLIRGTVVQVIKEEPGGVSQIRIDGITKPLFTRNDYLTRRPVKNIIGNIETPGSSTPSENLGENPAPGSPTPSPAENPVPGSPAPSPSP
jgi:hypothetical protein